MTLDSATGGWKTAGVSSLKTWEKRPSLTTGRVSTLFTSPWALCQISERKLPLAGRGGPANVQGSHPQGPGIGAMKWWRSVRQAGPKQSLNCLPECLGGDIPLARADVVKIQPKG